jgi:4-amino-4-deoxy-L-arabinose transferase-like glycosyltransferase
MKVLSKVPLWLEKAIFTIFVLITLVIIILNLKHGFGFDSIAIEAPNHFDSFTDLLAIFLIVLFFLCKKGIFQILHKINGSFIIISLLVMSIIMQYLVIKYLNVTPSWDFGILVDQSKYLLKTGKLVSYFVSYPNNVFAVCVLALFGKIFTPDLHVYQMINIAIITISQYLIYRLGTKVAGKEVGLLGFVGSVFFFPYIFYSPIVYTDTMSLLFLLIPMNIMVRKKNEFRLNILPLILSSVILSLGVLLKGSLIVFIIALSIVVFLYMKKWKRLFFIMPILLFMVVRLSFNTWIYDTHILNKQEVNKYSFPIIHWLVMGQNDETQGRYSDPDFRYTFTNIYKIPRDQLQKNELEEWKNRIKRRGLIGNAHFISGKLDNTWADGTYFSLNKLSRYPIKPQNYQSLTDGNSGIVIQGYARVQQLLLIAGLLLFSVFHWKSESRNKGFYTFSMLSLIGFLFFFLLWETRSRYIVSLTPLLIVLCSIGYSGQRNTSTIDDSRSGR